MPKAGHAALRREVEWLLSYGVADAEVAERCGVTVRYVATVRCETFGRKLRSDLDWKDLNRRCDNAIIKILHRRGMPLPLDPRKG